MEQWYYLDPDNRKSPPTNYNADMSFNSYEPHCCRCMKPILKEKGGFKSVTVHPVDPYVKDDPFGKELIGLCCWKKVQKEPIQSL
jgi:hypothetical protein